MKIAPSSSQVPPDITPEHALAMRFSYIRSNANGNDGWSYRLQGRGVMRFAPCTPSIDFQSCFPQCGSLLIQDFTIKRNLISLETPILDALIVWNTYFKNSIISVEKGSFIESVA